MDRTDKKTHTRLPVTLTDDDNRIVIEVRYALEKRLNKRLSWAETIRICIRTQANAEGISCT